MKKEIEDFLTKELVKELTKRAGVDTLNVEPYQLYSIIVGSEPKIEDVGSTVILVVTD